MSVVGQLRNRWFSRQHQTYVKDGLVLWLDGIENTRHGHDSASAKWENLVSDGLYDMAVPSSLAWQDDRLVFPGTDGAYINCNTHFGKPNEYTFEIVYKRDTWGSGSYRSIFSCVESGGTGWQGAVSESVERINVRRNTSSYYSRLATYSGDSSLDTRYKALTASLNDKKVRECVDGVWADVIDQYEGTRYNNSYFFCIGSEPKEYLPIKGFFNAVRIYNRPLSEAEIARNYAIDKKRFTI